MANGFTRSKVGSSGDVLVMDQRGTFYARPYLNCPEIDSARIQGIKKGFFGQKLHRLHLEAVQDCYNRWITDGADLDGYNTLESVQDIEDLRNLLSIDQLILYGMSYSCKLMSAYAMTYPDRVRAMILDSPLPHESNYDEEAWAAIDGVFRAVLNYYNGDDDLYQQWTDYVESVQDSAFTIDLDSISFRYTSANIIDAALNFLGDHGSLSQLPSVITRLIQGVHTDVLGVMESYLQSGRQAKGMRYSTWIAEELPDEDEAQIAKKSERVSWLANYAVNDVSFETARNWKVRSIYETKEWPDQPYEGPVFILSGAFDPWTPVAYGEKMKEKFSQAKLKIYPERTHLPGFTRDGATDIYEFIRGHTGR
jgi:pimeloyl-ACP methyl ester carboxylesterase